jgi:hypothetical protein
MNSLIKGQQSWPWLGTYVWSGLSVETGEPGLLQGQDVLYVLTQTSV